MDKCDHADKGGPCCLNQRVAPVNWCPPCRVAIYTLSGVELGIDEARSDREARMTATQALYESTTGAIAELLMALESYEKEMRAQ